jgi:hypothetical protein
VFSDGLVTVYFVDFGNSHTTPRGQLLVLPEAFRHLPALAIQCCLSGVRDFHFFLKFIYYFFYFLFEKEEWIANKTVNVDLS